MGESAEKLYWSDLCRDRRRCAAHSYRILHSRNGKCARESFPKNYVRGLPPYDLPLVLLARLAVDRRFTGKGLGHALISEAFKIALRVADDVGCRCIITDAYRNRVDWYARYGFVALEGVSESGPQRMFLDMRTIRMALRGTQ